MLYKVRVNVTTQYDKLVEAESETEASNIAFFEYTPWRYPVAGDNVAPVSCHVEPELAKRVSFSELSYPLMRRASSMGYTGLNEVNWAYHSHWVAMGY